MVKIRLARGGSKNNPFYRIVAIEERRARQGKPLEILGYWHPLRSDKKIDKKKIDKWVGRGAKVSKAVTTLIES